MRTQLKNQFQAFWQTRQPRERIFLIVLGTVVGCALWAQLLWSAQGARDKLQRQLPQLRQQAEAMQRQAGEVRQLQAQPAGQWVAEGAPLLAAATASARTLGLPLAGTQVQLEGSRQVRVRAQLPFDRWLEWVAVLQRDTRLRLVQCRIDPNDVPGTPNLPGTARVDALFALPEPG